MANQKLMFVGGWMLAVWVTLFVMMMIGSILECLIMEKGRIFSGFGGIIKCIGASFIQVFIHSFLMTIVLTIAFALFVYLGRKITASTGVTLSSF